MLREESFPDLKAEFIETCLPCAVSHGAKIDKHTYQYAASCREINQFSPFLNRSPVKSVHTMSLRAFR